MIDSFGSRNVALAAKKARLVFISTDYGFDPLSVYGVSKVAQDLLGFRYYRSYGLHNCLAIIRCAGLLALANDL